MSGRDRTSASTNLDQFLQMMMAQQLHPQISLPSQVLGRSTTGPIQPNLPRVGNTAATTTNANTRTDQSLPGLATQQLWASQALPSDDNRSQNVNIQQQAMTRNAGPVAARLPQRDGSPSQDTLTPHDLDTLFSPDLFSYLEVLNAQQRTNPLNTNAQGHPLSFPPSTTGAQGSAGFQSYMLQLPSNREVSRITQPSQIGSHSSGGSAAASRLPLPSPPRSSNTAWVNFPLNLTAHAKPTGTDSTASCSSTITTSSSSRERRGSDLNEKPSASVPLGLDEDQNWLTPFQCFTRLEFVEVFHASQRDVDIRSTSRSVTLDQIGIRCCWCKNLEPGERASRSSAFPSNIRQLYQSYTMMVRDHFTKCREVPNDKRGTYFAK